MQLLDKYLYAISRQLPREGKEEIITELRSSLLDTLEDQYGENPTEAEISNTLKNFGSPSSVAKEYGKSTYLINPGLTDLFVLIAKIIVLAMLGAFTVIFVVQLLTESDINIAVELLKIFQNTISSSLSAIGSLSLIFILISYFTKDEIEPEAFDPMKLEDLPADKEKVSVPGSIAGIIFSIIFITIFNLFPEIINLPINNLLEIENVNGAFNNLHTIDMARFSHYLILLNLFWLATILLSIMTLLLMKKTRLLRGIEILVTIASATLFFVMVSDASLYIGPMNFLGFRGLFLLLIILSVIDVISETIKLFIHE